MEIFFSAFAAETNNWTFLGYLICVISGWSNLSVVVARIAFISVDDSPRFFQTYFHSFFEELQIFLFNFDFEFEIRLNGLLCVQRISWFCLNLCSFVSFYFFPATIKQFPKIIFWWNCFAWFSLNSLGHIADKDRVERK